jgi:hypothetical protein
MALLPPRGGIRALSALAIGGSGFVLAVAFHAGYVLPLTGGILLLAAASVVAIALIGVTRLSLLSRFMLLVYALPFSVLIGYLLNPEFVWHFTPTGRQITQDHEVIRVLTTMGVVGLLGLVAGMRWAAVREPRAAAGTPMPEHRPGPTLMAPLFLVILFFAVVFSWLSTPPETIFEAAYSLEQSASVSESINFPAAYVLSYLLLIILVVDAERERSRSRRLAKLAAVGVAVAYIVVALQVLRGNRESAGLIVALTALYLTSRVGVASGTPVRVVTRRRMLRLLLPLSAFVVAFIALGAIRGMMAGASAATEVLTASEIFELGLAHNTWSAVLWTNLSLAWEYREAGVAYKYGQTYLDYLLSLPPGFLTQLLGFERPLESWQGIGWEDAAGVSSGGLHPVVAPFRNFGAYGVLLVLMLYGFLIARVEQKSESGSLWARMLWAAVFSAGFNWFWYGDMPFIRALMFAVILYFLYRVALSIRLSPYGAGAPDAMGAR